MLHNHSRIKRVWIIPVLLVALTGITAVAAQTGTGALPPTDFTEFSAPLGVYPTCEVIADASILAAAPEGILPFDNSAGLIAELPALSGFGAAGSYLDSPFKDDLGALVPGIFCVPLADMSLIVRLDQQPLDALQAAARLDLAREHEGRLIVPFTLGIFSNSISTARTEITDHTGTPILATFPIIDREKLPMLLRFDAATNTVQPLEAHIPEDDPANTTGVVQNADGTWNIYYDIVDSSGIFILVM